MRYSTAVPIGKGAVGEVFKAWDPKLQRQVALKILKQVDDESKYRMLREAQAQARIDHPNVCRVYDVDEDETGRPYISMQFIEGKTLDAIAPSLSVEERVALVETVCSAIQAAHAVGLIHRDLKPGNIMVERRQDGSLVPYVVDFGIAREHAEAGLTATGQVVGTPAFMSPEQARGEVRDLDRRSDVYSLGAVLYHLLSGRPPFVGDTGVQLLIQVLQREPDPLRKVMPRIPADLETIVMKCLEKEPVWRYPSALALGEDLRRYLDGKPIEARRAGFLYRLGKSARRHRAVTALVLLLAFGLPLGLLKYTLDLEAERALAVDARADAEDLMDFMLRDLYEGLEPLGRLDLLERVAERSLEYYGKRPVEGPDRGVQSRMARTFRNMGDVLQSQGLHDQALDSFRRYHELASSWVGEASGDVDARLALARSRWMMGEVYQHQGRLDEAAEHTLAALEEARRVSEILPEDPRVQAVLWESLAQAGWTLRERRQEETAEQLLVEALDLARERVERRPDDPETHHDLSVSLAYLGLLRLEADDLDVAAERFREALDITRSLVDGSPDNLKRRFELQLNLNRLAYTELLQGNVESSRRLYREAVATGQELVERDPRNTRWARELAYSHSELAYIAREEARYEVALEQMSESLAISRKLAALDPTSASAAGDLAWDLMEVGRNHEALGQPARARKLWEEGLKVIAPVSRSTGQDYYVSMHAQLLLLLSRPDEAAPLVERLREAGFADPDLEELAARLGIGE